MNRPLSITFMRHAESAYNKQRAECVESAEYKDFIREYEHNWQSDKAKQLAIRVAQQFAPFNTDHSTDLTDEGMSNAIACGEKLSSVITTPSAVVVSPYLRAQKTHQLLCQSWPSLSRVEVDVDERVREQEFGLRLLYGDWRAMNVCHPEQRALYRLQGPYWYRQPQGESVADVRERMKQWTTSILNRYNNKHLLVITHHVSILAFKANMESQTAEEFVQSYAELTPHHCAITRYECNPNSESFELVYFNKLLV